ncbi:MAG: hypothetical protein NT121_02640, partial [Chloroflexi bacterium]|nr:hypothetical protein [Chloroflexota bacterium]
MNATDIYNRMKISYAGNPEPIREIAKHTIVMQVEQFLQAPQEYKHVGDEIDDMFPRTGFQSEAGPEQLVQAALTCKCSAYEFPHRVAQGNCKQQPVSVMDELLSLTAIPGYKDAAI